MFRRKRGAAGPRSLSRQQFLDDLARGTRSLRDCACLHLMLEEGGTVGVRWQCPRGDHRQRYRIAGADGEGCPHCAILAGIETLAPVLPLDNLRAARTRDQYLLLLRMNKLPCPAFARNQTLNGPFGQVSGSRTGPGWAADCHMGEGNPHTTADCARHMTP